MVSMRAGHRKGSENVYDKGHRQAYHLSGIQPDSPVLECAVRVADETSNRTIECPVLAQMINQNCILIIKFSNQCAYSVRIIDAMLVLNVLKVFKL